MTLSEKASAATLLTVLTVLFFAWREDQRPAIPDSTQTTIDSLASTQGDFDSVTTNTLAGVDRQASVVASLQKAVGRAKREADAQRRLADSLLALPRTEADSGPFWKQMHDTRLAENVALRQVVDSQQSQIDTLTAGRDSARVVARLALERLDVTSGVVVDLRASITKLTTCRIGSGVLSVPCPTRKAAAIGGALAGVVGSVVLFSR